MQVRDQLSIQSKNWRWATPGLEYFIFGPKLAFIYRHMYLILFGLLAGVFLVFNWMAMLASLVASLILCNGISPISKRHAAEIIRQVDIDAGLLKAQTPGGPTKKCAQCGTVRRINYFSLESSSSDGHGGLCVACGHPEMWATV